jgi:DNA-binding phage protein
MMKNNPTPKDDQWKLIVLFLKNVAKEKGISNNDIVERTGLMKSNVSRLFSLKHCPELRVIMAVSHAIGITLRFDDIDATIDIEAVFQRSKTEYKNNTQIV